MSPRKFEENGYDRTSHKEYRRGIIHDLLASCESMTGTNYPTDDGAKEMYKLMAEYPGKKIVLAENGSFKKDWLPEVTKLRNTDVFTAMITHPADLLDIDLYGGLAMYAKIAIERAEKWRYLLLTCAGIYRNKSGIPGACPKNQAFMLFMQDWADSNGWQIALRDQYKHKNKREVLGIPDNRGPWYYTYLISRSIR